MKPRDEDIFERCRERPDTGHGQSGIGEARRQLRECTRLLRERLGVAPSSRLRELYRACGLTGQGLTVLPGGAAPGGRSGTEG